MGAAFLKIELVGWSEGKVAPALAAAEVVVPKIAVKTEAVSARLIRSLPHPERKASMPIVTFTPTGELIVSGYPSGVVQIFDPATGKELRTIETPRGYRGGFNYLQVSRDARTLFVALDDSKFEPVQMGEKKSYYRRYSGEISVYDLASGAKREPLRVEPRRGVGSLAVSPDGTKLATMEFTSGPSDAFATLRAMYLWDVATKTAIKLRDGYGDPRFSADGKTVLVTVSDQSEKTGVVYAYSSATGTLTGQQASAGGPWPPFAFSKDGQEAVAASIDAASKESVLRRYDPATLAVRGELARGAAPFSHLTFSPDGKRLAAVAKTTVHLWDLASGQLVRTWPLDTPGRVWHLAFDAAGERLAASTWFIPPELQNARDEVVEPQDFPQAKVFLIDTAAPQPEAIVCPHGYWGRPAFSPNGKYLAVGGSGATHLFDVGTK